jgi:chaperonin GroEL (HSP60 family)
MLKMLLDPMGGIVLTNDGNAILREVRKHTRILSKCYVD